MLVAVSEAKRKGRQFSTVRTCKLLGSLETWWERCDWALVATTVLVQTYVKVIIDNRDVTIARACGAGAVLFIQHLVSFGRSRVFSVLHVVIPCAVEEGSEAGSWCALSSPTRACLPYLFCVFQGRIG